MFRVLWRFPMYAPDASTPTVTPASETWAYPVFARGYPSSHTIVQDPVEFVEFGHREASA